MPSIRDISADAPTCIQYIDTMSPMYKAGFLRSKEDYTLNSNAVEKLIAFAKEYHIVVIFADWCGDARKAVPVLSLIEQATEMKIVALGGMTKPPYGSDKFWAVPPSPVEVDIFGITSSPTVLIFNSEGNEIGRIKTRPKMEPTLEQEIVKIIEDSQGS
ncbi:MAG: thioredoxin family protein [Candidatus Thorarchaeota archaeon]